MPSMKSPVGVLVTVSEDKSRVLLGQGFTLVEPTEDPPSAEPAPKTIRRTTKG